MTPTPKTTLFTTPQTTLNKHPNLHLRGKETQEAYLLHLHDHNCMKMNRYFLFTDFLNPVCFHFRQDVDRGYQHLDRYSININGT